MVFYKCHLIGHDLYKYNVHLPCVHTRFISSNDAYQYRKSFTLYYSRAIKLHTAIVIQMYV